MNWSADYVAADVAGVQVPHGETNQVRYLRHLHLEAERRAEQAMRDDKDAAKPMKNRALTRDELKASISKVAGDMIAEEEKEARYAAADYAEPDDGWKVHGSMVGVEFVTADGQRYRVLDEPVITDDEDSSVEPPSDCEPVSTVADQQSYETPDSTGERLFTQAEVDCSMSDYDIQRLEEWIDCEVRLPANTAFTAGAARRVACRIEDALTAAEKGHRRVPLRPGTKVSYPQLDQLHAARYCYHKQIAKRYADQVQSGQLPVEQGRGMYVAAMANYDGIIASAVNGHLTDANGADMEKGFPL